MANTIVVITADHGEGLGERERYFGHVRYLNRQFIQVPLIVYIPGTTPKRIATPASLVGLSPTLLEFLGFRDNRFRFEESLLQTIREPNNPDRAGRDNGDARETKPVYSFAFSPSSVEDRFSVIQWPYQCIFNKDGSGTVTREVYQLAISQSYRKWDELSADVLARQSKKDYTAMQQAYLKLGPVFTKKKITGSKTLTREESEKLKTMGYLQ